MSPTVPHFALARPRAVRMPSRAGGAPERLRLLLQAVLVALQVAWFTLVGWLGATLALLPVAIRGAPVGRRAERRQPRYRLLPSPTAEDVAGR